MSFQDDKAKYVVPFILSNLKKHRDANPGKPFFVGLNGCQGAGKTVLVDVLRSTFESPPHNLSTIVFSLDDLYLTHEDQSTLARSNPDNPLLQHRGQPGTHDIELALKTFKTLKQGRLTKIPAYNKAAFNGEGDRDGQEIWETVNTDPARPVSVVIFEGWCVGFRSLPEEELIRKHEEAVVAARDTSKVYTGRLGHNTLESVAKINNFCKKYDELTNQFDAFIHIDAADPQYVYEWRLEQEAGLRAKRGSGMTDDQVKKFVDGYYPAYELYTQTLREGVFKPRQGSVPGEVWKARQMRLLVGQDRKVREVEEI